ncbi:nuclear speckle splicing regulatory protein 1 homolog [Aspergillus udagawae]|nr:nuclear speckle splicing regulatory protein 1 homolog [Aspergillus udagawae]GFG00604.1 nuclear speckle splicing regulatory protein 1 homolog [Aspergillus udagawae]GFG19823.1 nuclear speckle splicing regulatory protein 1 homolog [Aspergillus udagawae]
MAPPKLSYGLNLPSKKPPTSKLGPPGSQKRKKTIFDSDSEGDNQNDAGDGDGDGPVEITTIGGLEEPARPSPSDRQTREPPAKRKPPAVPPTGKPNIKPLSKSSLFADEEEEQEPQAMPLGLNPAKNKPSAPSRTEYTDLSALRSSKKHAEDAQQLDPTIYSYDAIYDSLHAKSDKAKAAAPDAKSDGPRYMTSLLRSAEIRKRDQLRARDRLLAKEREAEGDEFAEKEKFVTSAYKAQQEELRRIEQEEAERERQEEERRKQNGGTGMVGFYRDMLSRDEQRHEEVVKAAEEAARRVQAGEIPADEAAAEAETNKEKTEAQIAAELNAKGAHIAINDEGQIVDKRQLLSAGLNVAPKPKPSASASAAAAAARAAANKPRFDSGHQAARASQRARQTEMVAQQLEEKARQEAEAEAARQREIAERTRTRKTETDVSSARERYLARKREREEAAKRGS